MKGSVWEEGSVPLTGPYVTLSGIVFQGARLKGEESIFTVAPTPTPPQPEDNHEAQKVPSRQRRSVVSKYQVSGVPGSRIKSAIMHMGDGLDHCFTLIKIEALFTKAESSSRVSIHTWSVTRHGDCLVHVSIQGLGLVTSTQVLWLAD